MATLGLKSDSKPKRQVDKQSWPCSEKEERVAL